MIYRVLISLAIILMLFACDKPTEPKVALPLSTFNPSGGTYSSVQTVEISNTVANAIIRYTLDGSDPNIQSPVYSAPIGIMGGTTIKAWAYKTKMKPSPIASAAYTFKVTSVFISPENGTYTEPQTVQFYSSTEGTIIHYTLDGTEPTENSLIYAEPIVIDANTIVKAKGFIAGWEPSETANANYSFNVTELVISVADGVFNNPFDVSITTQTNGANIRYTTDNTNPTESSSLYTTPITINTSTILKVKAFKLNCIPSNIQTAVYSMKVLTPQINPASGSYSASQSATITCQTPDSDIYYTTDGTTPSQTSNRYIEPLTISSNTNLKAKAFRGGWVESEIKSVTYNIVVSTPTFTPDAGNYLGSQIITMNCATPGARIHYTTNHSEPTSSSALYTEPITITNNVEIKAKGYKTGLNESSTASASYNIIPIQTVSTPTFSLPSGNYYLHQTIEILCATEGASIKYTTDGSEPTQTSIPYLNPFVIYNSTNLRAKAFRYGWNSSNTANANYNISSIPDYMVMVQGGSYSMGCTTSSGDNDEYPAHQVTVSLFYLSDHEVTQQEYESITETNPSINHYSQSLPVDNVSFYDAIAYCNMMSAEAQLFPCYEYIGHGIDISEWPADWNVTSHNNIICHFERNGYRLPTEAEWEFAGKGGNATHNYNYAGSNSINDVGWYDNNSSGQSHNVKLKAPNELNLYDMTGNIWEIVWDWFETYNSESITNPTGPENGTYKVFKGGMWYASSSYARVAGRSYAYPYSKSATYGFRVAMTVNGRSK